MIDTTREYDALLRLFAQATASCSATSPGGSEPTNYQGLTDDLALWAEYEAATRRRQAIVWSKGLKGDLGVAELDDLEAAEQAEDVGTQEVRRQLVMIEWRAVVAAGAHLELVEMLEDHGLDAVDDRLEQLVMEYLERERGRAIAPNG